jgi:hypothetical protein
VSIAVQLPLRKCDDCEEHAMTDPKDLGQPDTVSTPITNYLDMTTPRRRRSKDQTRSRRREERERGERPPIDTRGLGLADGNDFA